MDKIYLVNHNYDKLYTAPLLFLWTIQGEGRRVGKPTLFIRLAGCNFKCKGFNCEYMIEGEKRVGCDSYFAVDRDFKKDGNVWYRLNNVSEVLEAIEMYRPKDFTNSYDVVFTGGEPLLYWKNKIFQSLLKYFICDENRDVWIETNGSIFIPFTEDYQKHILFSISPKLSISGEPPHKRFRPDYIVNIFKNCITHPYLKFVVSRESINTDIDEIKRYIKHIEDELGYSPEVYIMPLGMTKQEIEENENDIVELCMREGFIFSPRMHVMLWDDEKGK